MKKEELEKSIGKSLEELMGLEEGNSLVHVYSPSADGEVKAHIQGGTRNVIYTLASAMVSYQEFMEIVEAATSIAKTEIEQRKEKQDEGAMEENVESLLP